jgi:hypothetical protein
MSGYPTFATIADAVAAYLAGTTRRHARIDGQVIDLHQAAHPVEVARGEWVDVEELPALAVPEVECCRACGRPLIGRVP